MKIGIANGPGESGQIQNSYFVYDIHSGVIVAVHHFVGSKDKSTGETEAELLEQTHKTFKIPVENLSILVNPQIPSGEGQLCVESIEKKANYKQTEKQLVRKHSDIGFRP